MSGVVGATPLLVYNRIAENRRRTGVLLVVFAIVLLPALSGVAGCLIVPSLAMRYGPAHPAEMAALQDQMRTLKPSADGTYRLLDLPPPFLWMYARFNVEATALVTLVFVAITAVFIYLYGSRAVLRSARARRVQPGHEQDLVQIVENLCIAAGLPRPRIHIIESAAPNAFATGRTPHDASLVVTRGLIELLNRPELEGVIAHELSHIGNQDIGFSTTLAALVGTLSLPLKAITAPFRFAFARSGAAAAGSLGLGFLTVFGLGPFVFLAFWIISILGDREYYASVPYYWWWMIYVTIAPLYAVFVAPVVGLLIRQAVSRQREFLADADAALLTRNPEALALALVKIGAAGGERLQVGESTVHLYFVDPRSKRSWLHAVFPSHPPMEKRIELLARMGNGLAPSAIQAARDAGTRVHISAEETTDPISTNDDALIQLYDRPDDGSHVLAFLAENAAVKVEGRDGDFVRVTTGDGVTGYVVRFARLRIQHAPISSCQASGGSATADHTLIPLYEQADGWSRVVAELPANAVVTPVAIEGQFIRVTTAEHQAGYVSRSAPLAALKDLHR